MFIQLSLCVLFFLAAFGVGYVNWLAGISVVSLLFLVYLILLYRDYQLFRLALRELPQHRGQRIGESFVLPRNEVLREALYSIVASSMNEPLATEGKGSLGRAFDNTFSIGKAFSDYFDNPRVLVLKQQESEQGWMAIGQCGLVCGSRLINSLIADLNALIAHSPADSVARLYEFDSARLSQIVNFAVPAKVHYVLLIVEGAQYAIALLGRGGSQFHNRLEEFRVELDRVGSDRTAELQQIIAQHVLRQKVDLLQQQVSRSDAEIEARVDFLSHFSHDLRSPINNIAASLKLLELSLENDQDRQLVQSSLFNCNQLSNTISDVLDLSRHDAGRLNTIPEIFHFVDDLEEIVNGYRVIAELKGLQLYFSVENLSARTLYCDPSHLRRVVSNIVGNALKYTREGSVSLRVFEQDSGEVRIEISDTGPGISEVLLPKLFRKYQRGDVREEGVGLGLAVANILIEECGGEIAVDSEVGVGSKFTVALPRVHQGAVAAITARSRQLRDFKKLLLVDDDVDCQRSFSRLLKREGYQVQGATSVQEAIAMLQIEEPDCILLDLGIPGGGGEEVLNFLSRKDSNTAVIVVSGRPDARSMQLLVPQIIDVVEKPADFQDLLRALRGPIQEAV